MKIVAVQDSDGAKFIARDDGSKLSPIAQANSLLHFLDEHRDLESQFNTLSCSMSREQLSSYEPLALMQSCPAFFDGSAFLSHIERARKARGAEVPTDLAVTPLLYQGCAEYFLGASESVQSFGVESGLDLEAELGVVLRDTPSGVNSAEAENYILGFVLLSDWTLRNLFPQEFSRGFGFIQSKPPSTLAPAFRPLRDIETLRSGSGYAIDFKCSVNGEVLGNVCAEQMHFSFAELIAHAAKTRPLRFGTIIGSGTISHTDIRQGFCCLAEKRAVEMTDLGKAHTRFLQQGDRVEISASAQGEDLFGTIDVEII